MPGGGRTITVCAVAACGQRTRWRAMSGESRRNANRFMLSRYPSSRILCRPRRSRRLSPGSTRRVAARWRGPVVAAAVVLCKPRPGGLDDSKAHPRTPRSARHGVSAARCAWGIGVVDVDDIDRLNIFQATMLAMTLAMHNACAKRWGAIRADVLVGRKPYTRAGRRPEWRWNARPIVGGDALEPCISAASIIAKEYRDRLMREHAQAHPHYGWDKQQGLRHARPSRGAADARADPAASPQLCASGAAADCSKPRTL